MTEAPGPPAKPQPKVPGSVMRRVPRGEVAEHGPHEGVERRARVALPKMCCCEAGYEPVDAEIAHGLVAKIEARCRIAAEDEAPDPHERTVCVEGEQPRHAQLASAVSESAEVVSVLQVSCKHDVADVEEHGRVETNLK